MLIMRRLAKSRTLMAGEEIVTVVTAIMIDSTIAHHRLSNQRLTGQPFSNPQDVIRWLTAVQSQDYAGAKWAIAQRSGATDEPHIDTLFNDGKILRTHVMRPTWHFVMPADIRWMLKLTAPRVNTASTYYYRKLELDNAVFRRSNAAITKALRDGKQLTRAELATVLKRAGIAATGPRLAYLMMRAELDAVICSGALRGKQFTYALLDERVREGATLERNEALAELTRRYFTSHGPALMQDYAWWSGLTMTDVKAGIDMASPQLGHETLDGKTYWFGELGTTPKTKATTIHLLPNYDEYLIAYKDRGVTFDASLKEQLGPNNTVLFANIVVLNGQVVGGWRRTMKKEEVTVNAYLLFKPSKGVKGALRLAAERYGQFVGKSASLVVHEFDPHSRVGKF